jgi:hypothetical protein
MDLVEYLGNPVHSRLGNTPILQFLELARKSADGRFEDGFNLYRLTRLQKPEPLLHDQCSPAVRW